MYIACAFPAVYHLVRVMQCPVGSCVGSGARKPARLHSLTPTASKTHAPIVRRISTSRSVASYSTTNAKRVVGSCKLIANENGHFFLLFSLPIL